MKLSTGLIFTLFLVVAIGALIYFFMKSPKMSVQDSYNSLGNHGVCQRMTGKDYSYHSEPDPDESQYDFIDNSINFPKSDVVNPPNLLARRRILMQNGML